MKTAPDLEGQHTEMLDVLQQERLALLTAPGVSPAVGWRAGCRPRFEAVQSKLGCCGLCTGRPCAAQASKPPAIERTWI